MNRLMKGAFVGMLTTALACLGSTVAQAGPERCGAGSACFYEHPNFEGSELERWANNGTLTGNFAYMNNLSSSLATDGQLCTFTVFFDSMSLDAREPHIILHSKTLVGTYWNDSDLAYDNGLTDWAHENWDNRISSYSFAGC